MLGFEFTPWVASDLFCVLGSAFPLWVFPGAFCILRSSSFSLGSLRCFGILMSGLECLLRDWAGPLGSCVLYFFLSYRPLAQCWARGCPFCSSVCFFFRPADPPHSVRGHGLGNRAAKQRHGTVGFSCSFFFLSSCRRPPQLRAGGAARVSWLLTQ